MTPTKITEISSKFSNKLQIMWILLLMSLKLEPGLHVSPSRKDSKHSNSAHQVTHFHTLSHWLQSRKCSYWKMTTVTVERRHAEFLAGIDVDHDERNLEDHSSATDVSGNLSGSIILNIRHEGVYTANTAPGFASVSVSKDGYNTYSRDSLVSCSENGEKYNPSLTLKTTPETSITVSCYSKILDPQTPDLNNTLDSGLHDPSLWNLLPAPQEVPENSSDSSLTRPEKKENQFLPLQVPSNPLPPSPPTNNTPRNTTQKHTNHSNKVGVYGWVPRKQPIGQIKHANPITKPLPGERWPNSMGFAQDKQRKISSGTDKGFTGTTTTTTATQTGQASK